MRNLKKQSSNSWTTLIRVLLILTRFKISKRCLLTYLFQDFKSMMRLFQIKMSKNLKILEIKLMAFKALWSLVIQLDYKGLLSSSLIKKGKRLVSITRSLSKCKIKRIICSTCIRKLIPNFLSGKKA